MTRKRFRQACGIIAALGFLLVLGTAGASDCDLIPMSQILRQGCIGLGMFASGLWLGGYLSFMQQRLGLSMKANWQIYPTAKRMVSAVGYRFSRTHVILRKRNFLRFTRQCRRVKKRLDAGKPIMFAQASGLLSRAGQLKHCNSHTIRVKYIDPIGVKHLKEVVRNESKRRQRAQQRILAGGAA